MYARTLSPEFLSEAYERFVRNQINYIKPCRPSFSDADLELLFLGMSTSYEIFLSGQFRRVLKLGHGYVIIPTEKQEVLNIEESLVDGDSTHSKSVFENH